MKNTLSAPKRRPNEYSQLLVPLIAVALLVVFNLLRDPGLFLHRAYDQQQRLHRADG